MTAADAAISIVLTDREGRMDLCIVLMIGRCESFIHGSQPCEGGTGKEVEEHITAACQERSQRGLTVIDLRRAAVSASVVTLEVADDKGLTRGCSLRVRSQCTIPTECNMTSSIHRLIL